MKLIYFKEKNGDYGCLYKDPEHGNWGRSTSLANQPASMATTKFGQTFIPDNAKRVKKSDVPKKWLRAINGE